jgi:monofunctional biosynthetic peptidoglycan transglycosylase
VSRFWSRLNLGHFILFLSAVTVLGAGYLSWSGYRFFRSEFPDTALLRSRFPVVVYQGSSQPPRIVLRRDRPDGWVSIGQVARAAVGAVVVSEDWAFYSHSGYDANQIREAIKEDFQAGRFARGASTITQQVVRNVFLDKDKNLWRKLKEVWLAVKLEDSVEKKRILEVYLNIAEWGEGVFGIGQASRHYFGKAAADLTPKEGAFLAMLLPSPKRYSQSFKSRRLTDYARSTVNSILRKMTQARYITEEERDSELMTPLAFESLPESAL